MVLCHPPFVWAVRHGIIIGWSAATSQQPATMQLSFFRSSLWRSLRHRNYRLYLTGQLVSVCGTWMQQVALSWLVYRLTGSATLLGVVGFASQIPILLLGPIGGA